MSTIKPTLKPLLFELREQTAKFSARCKTVGWWGAMFHIGVQQEVLSDVAQAQQKLADCAYSAEQSDREALKLLEDAAKDGLQSSDMPAIAAAIRHIRRSAEKDRSISEAAAV